MAAAEVTGRGIVVVFAASEVADDVDPVNQDEAKIESAFADAVAELGATVEQVDAVTSAQPWGDRRDVYSGSDELVQLFAWKPGVTAANWRK